MVLEAPCSFELDLVAGGTCGGVVFITEVWKQVGHSVRSP